MPKEPEPKVTPEGEKPKENEPITAAIEIKGKKRTPEEIEEAFEVKDNYKAMKQQLDAKGEQVNSNLRDLLLLKQMREKGLNPEEMITAKPKGRKGILPDPSDYNADDEAELERFARDEQIALRSFADKTTEGLSNLQDNTLKTQKALLNMQSQLAVQNFALMNGLDLRTGEGRAQLQRITKFGAEQGFFENVGSRERPEIVIDGIGLDAAYQKIQLEEFREAARAGDPVRANRSARSLLGDGVKLDFNFSPLPSRAGAMSDEDLENVAKKVGDPAQSGNVSKSEIEALKSAGFYIPDDFPVKT